MNDDRIKRLAGKIDQVLVDAAIRAWSALQRKDENRHHNPKAIEEVRRQTAIFDARVLVNRADGWCHHLQHHAKETLRWPWGNPALRILTQVLEAAPC
jgi:hypothetical protein